MKNSHSFLAWQNNLYLNTALLLGFWSVFLYSILYVSYNLLYLPLNPQKGFLEIFKNWDGGHYLGIAEFGYSENFQLAFFPLYPLLIKGLNLLINNFTYSGLIISFISIYLSLIILYRLALFDFSKKAAWNALILFLIFPTSLYLILAYSESLFLLFSLVTFYFFRKYLKSNEKKNLYLAILFSSLSTLTRISGLAIVSSLIFWLILNKKFKKNWEIIFSLSGILIICFLNFAQTGNFLYFLEAQEHWQRWFAPLGGLWEVLLKISSTQINFWDINWFINLIFFVFGFGMVFRSLRFFPKYYFFFGFISLLIPLYSSSLASFPRFVLPIFPIFFVLVKVKNKTVKVIFSLLSLILLILFTFAYGANIWIS